MIFLQHPSTWMLLAIALVVSLSMRETPTRAAAAGLICYVASFALSNAYSYVPYVEAVLLWQGGLFALLPLYSAVGRKLWPLPFAMAALGIYLLDYMTRYSLEFFVSALVTAVVFQIYWKISGKDVLGRMVWGVVLVFEGWSAIEIPGCRVFAKIENAAEMWRTTGESVCTIAFGPLAHFFITGVTLALLAWIGWRWKQNRRNYGS